VGLPILGAVFFWRPNPLLVVIAVLALPKAWAAMKGTTPVHAIVASPADRMRYMIQYLALTLGLAALAFDAHERLSA
jgi:hypothetical protein